MSLNTYISLEQSPRLGSDAHHPKFLFTLWNPSPHPQTTTHLLTITTDFYVCVCVCVCVCIHLLLEDNLGETVLSFHYVYQVISLDSKCFYPWATSTGPFYKLTHFLEFWHVAFSMAPLSIWLLSFSVITLRCIGMERGYGFLPFDCCIFLSTEVPHK